MNIDKEFKIRTFADYIKLYDLVKKGKKLTPQEEIAVQDFERQINELNPKRKRKSELGT